MSNKRYNSPGYKHYFKNMVEELPAIILEIDRTFNINYVNYYAVSTTGYKPGDLKSKKITDLIINEDRKEFALRLEDLCDGKSFEAVKCSIKIRGKKRLAVLLKVSTITDSKKKIELPDQFKQEPGIP